MFTGLVQRVGSLRRRLSIQGGARLDISAGAWPEPLALGESIAVQGACLTVAETTPDGFVADVLEETLDCTTLGSLPTGSRLNLERALRPMDRFGGHFVSGHVDARGRLVEVRDRGRDVVFRIVCPPDESRYVVRKGSIAIDGVSLTVSALGDEDQFEVNLIPTTWRDTTLADRRVGDALNLETDLVGKYVERLLGTAPPKGITWASLAEAGFPV